MANNLAVARAGALQIILSILLFSSRQLFCQTLPPPVANSLRVCVVERAPFTSCGINSADEWEPSYQVDLFEAMVENLDDPVVKSAIQPNFQCIGRSTAELILELSRPFESRSCDILIAPITITDERKQNISFVEGVHFTYAIPVSAAENLGTGNELTFWLRPFQTSAWLVNLGILLGMGLAGGILALFLNSYWRPPVSTETTVGDLAMKSASSLTSIFGQHPSHGVLPDSRSSVGEVRKNRASDVMLAMFFAAGVFALAITTMLYAGNLAAIQSQPTVVPTIVDLADLYGLKVLSNTIYAGALPSEAVLENATIANTGDVLTAIKKVDQSQVDAFLWDADIVLSALAQAEANEESICVYAMKKRVFPFQLGIGVGKDLAPQVVESLQKSLNFLRDSGVQRDLRQKFLQGFRKFIGRPVCPGAAQGLTYGQTAGVYVVPAIVFGALMLGCTLVILYRKWKCGKTTHRSPATSHNAASAPPAEPHHHTKHFFSNFPNMHRQSSSGYPSPRFQDAHEHPVPDHPPVV